MLFVISPKWSIMVRKSLCRGGSSMGWVQTYTWSAMISEGHRSRCGTSSRISSQAASSRQRSAGSHPMAFSTEMNSSPKRWNTPSTTRLVMLA